LSVKNTLKQLTPRLAACWIHDWFYSFEPFVPVFMIHRLTDVENHIFDHSLREMTRQFEWLRKSGWVFLSLSELEKRSRECTPVPARTAVFTVDDGYLDQYQMAEWLFDRFDCPVTYYVATDFVDGSIWLWDAKVHYAVHNSNSATLSYSPYGKRDAPEVCFKLSDVASRNFAVEAMLETLKNHPSNDVYAEVSRIFEIAEVDEPSVTPPQYRAMTWAQANSLIARGHTIAPHTRSHRILSKLDDISAAAEIEGSWRITRERISRQPANFAFPNGRRQDFCPRDVAALEQLGCSLAVTTVPGHAILSEMRKPGCSLVPRFSLPNDYFSFCQYASWIERANDLARQ
jgi:peptidoglycan/xylan/chitin deacetylase (PgdA/CDA1 family)